MFRCRSEWARCISLALLLLLKLLFMTTGSAIPLRTGYHDQIVRQSSIIEGDFRKSTAYALPDVRVNLKGSSIRKSLHADSGRSLVFNFLDDIGPIQVGPEAISRTEEMDSRTIGHKYDSRNRRFLRGARSPGPPSPQAWFLKQDQGRRVMVGINSTTATGQQTQPFYLSPHAPGIDHNKKQDWSQDYAEPDTHPPESN
ncbi:protein MpRGF [Marchantia polymorpha subsp. ruderalis]|nr:hypothetical protein MARPO_0060s0001 [Marchantia polymorpha]BBN14139.1 hypothetical protein Mp_6g09180 [Marchantia polymorpha subsp. ruderalis]|eukprot:PTQ36904.1 hypothetical protein MARPO_0060s0001 [Marchantia polymorpha]